MAWEEAPSSTQNGAAEVSVFPPEPAPARKPATSNASDRKSSRSGPKQQPEAWQRLAAAAAEASAALQEQQLSLQSDDEAMEGGEDSLSGLQRPWNPRKAKKGDVGRSPTFEGWAGSTPSMLGQNPCGPTSMRRSSWCLADYEVLSIISQRPGYKSCLAVYKRTRQLVMLKAYSIPMLRDGPGGKAAEDALRKLVTMRCSLASHDNIVMLYGAFKEAAEIIMVEEHMEGGDLQQLLNRAGGQLTEAQAVRFVLLPLCRALAYLDASGVQGRASVRPRCMLYADDAGRHMKLLPDIDLTASTPPPPQQPPHPHDALQFLPIYQQFGGVCARTALLMFRLLAGSNALASPASFELFLSSGAPQRRGSLEAARVLSQQHNPTAEAALCRRLAAAQLPTTWSTDACNFVHTALEPNCKVSSLMNSAWVIKHQVQEVSTWSQTSLSPSSVYSSGAYAVVNASQDAYGGDRGGGACEGQGDGIDIACDGGSTFVESEAILRGLGLMDQPHFGCGMKPQVVDTRGSLGAASAAAAAMAALSDTSDYSNYL